VVTSDFIPQKEIEKAAIRFLKEHHPDGSIPIPIDEIVEIKLKIKVVPSPGLLRNHGIDAFSTPDFKEIYIDHMQFTESENRARFTLAHEVGHYFLHGSFIKEQATFTDLDEWRNFVIRDIRRDPLETQANMFAAFLLLPTDSLAKEYQESKSELAKNEGFGGALPDDRTLAPYLAKPISRKFKVSERCAELRIGNWLNSRQNIP